MQGICFAPKGAGLCSFLLWGSVCIVLPSPNPNQSAPARPDNTVLKHRVSSTARPELLEAVGEGKSTLQPGETGGDGEVDRLSQTPQNSRCSPRARTPWPLQQGSVRRRGRRQGQRLPLPKGRRAAQGPGHRTSPAPGEWRDADGDGSPGPPGQPGGTEHSGSRHPAPVLPAAATGCRYRSAPHARAVPLPAAGTSVGAPGAGSGGGPQPWRSWFPAAPAAPPRSAAGRAGSAPCSARGTPGCRGRFAGGPTAGRDPVSMTGAAVRTAWEHSVRSWASSLSRESATGQGNTGSASQSGAGFYF